jgi:hypothetical protein
VDSFAVFQKNHPQVSVLHLWNLDPPSDPTVSLHCFFDRAMDSPFYPLFANDSPVWTLGRTARFSLTQKGLSRLLPVLAIKYSYG